MKTLVLDSGIMINLSMNGLLYILEELKKISNIRLVTTNQVKYEVVDRPLGIPRFEFGAFEIKDLIDRKIIEMPEDFGIPSEKLNSSTNEFKEIANHSVQANGKWIDIVSNAEMSCLALSKELTKKKIENIIGIDERTTRLLAEKPENLESMMAGRLHQRITLNKKNFPAFKEFRFIRSAEIVYVAYKKGIIKLKGPKILEAVLFATKFHGSSISYEEINELKKL